MTTPDGRSLIQSDAAPAAIQQLREIRTVIWGDVRLSANHIVAFDRLVEMAGFDPNEVRRGA